MAADVPTVSVLVVTWNNEQDIEGCLAGVLRQDDGRQNIEIVVVDNASSDRTAELLASYGDKVRLLVQDENRGFAAGMNIAARAATGDFLLVLNPDCEMDDGCVFTLWSALATRPGVGLAAARLRNPDGTPQAFARRWLSRSTVAWTLTDAGQHLDRRFRSRRAERERRYTTELEALAADDDPLPVDCPAGACVMVWAHHARPQLFDERFPLFFNDAELALRLHHKGYGAVVVPSAGAIHRGGTSHGQLNRARRRAEFVASLRLYVSSTSSASTSAVTWLALFADAAVSAMRWATPIGPRSRRKEAFANLRGVLGGLGLPFGCEPWLSKVPGPKARARRAGRRLTRSVIPTARSLARRARRRAFIVRLRLAGRLSRASVTVRVHRLADVPWNVTFEVRPAARAVVEIGEKAQIQPGLTLRLQGTLIVGHHSQLRYGANLNVKGTLRFEGRNVLGRGATIHADHDMTWEWGACCSEYVTVVDTDHAVDGSLVHVHDQPIAGGSVHLGGCAWVGSHAVVLPRVSIGAGTVVGANSVASRTLPPGVVAVGAPAVPVRAMPKAWHAAGASAATRADGVDGVGR